MGGAVAKASPEKFLREGHGHQSSSQVVVRPRILAKKNFGQFLTAVKSFTP